MSERVPPAPADKFDWFKLLKPEEREAAREKIAHIKREFFEVYKLKWTEYDTFTGRRRAVATFDSVRAEAIDYGPLSYWVVDDVTPGGARTRVAGGDSITYEVAKIEAMEAMTTFLDLAVASAEEALKDPPETGATGATGPTGATGRTGPVAPAPTAPMAPSAAGPHPISGWTGLGSMTVSIRGAVPFTAPDDSDEEP
jgi:hypothetical protein